MVGRILSDIELIGVADDIRVFGDVSRIRSCLRDHVKRAAVELHGEVAGAVLFRISVEVQSFSVREEEIFVLRFHIGRDHGLVLAIEIHGIDLAVEHTAGGEVRCIRIVDLVVGDAENDIGCNCRMLRLEKLRGVIVFCTDLLDRTIVTEVDGITVYDHVGDLTTVDSLGFPGYEIQLNDCVCHI